MTVPIEPTPPAKLEQKKYVVAFLDFLGAKEKMTSPEESDKFLQQIKKIYDEALALKTFENDNKLLKMEDVKIKIFSDNIVIARECTCQNFGTYGLAECFSILMFCAGMQSYALIYGLLLRGAIAIGDFYIDNTFVFGEALVRASELESNIAVYPRIIMSEEVSAIVASPLYKEHMNKWIVQDSDRKWSVNFIAGHVANVDRDIAIQLVTAVRQRIIEIFQSKAAVSSLKIRRKYYWMVMKFNELCDDAGFGTEKIAFKKFHHLIFIAALKMGINIKLNIIK